VSLDWRDVPGIVFAALAEIKHTLLAVACAFDEYREPIGSACSDHHVYGRRVLENCAAFELGHAAHHPYDEIALIGSRSAQFADARVDFAFGFFTHGASIQQHDIGVVDRVTQVVAGGS
jgi:hypothetical protein